MSSYAAPATREPAEQVTRLTTPARPVLGSTSITWSRMAPMTSSPRRRHQAVIFRRSPRLCSLSEGKTKTIYWASIHQ